MTGLLKYRSSGVWIPQSSGGGGGGSLGLNVRLAPYNAVGNGIANDTPAIAAAIADGVLLGLPVYFPKGVYLLGTPLAVPAGNDLHLRGDGYGSQVKSGVASGTAFYLNNDGGTITGFLCDGVRFTGGAGEAILFRVDYALDGVIQHSRFDSSSGTGVHLGRPQNFTFKNSEVRDCQSWGVIVGMNSSGDTGQTCRIKDSTIATCGLSGDNSGGIYLKDGGEHVVSGCQIEAMDETPDTVGLLITSLRHRITDNTFELNSVNMQFGTATGVSGRNKASGNAVVGGDIRFVNYSYEMVHNNIFQDGQTLPWRVIFETSPNGPSASTQWTDNSIRHIPVDSLLTSHYTINTTNPNLIIEDRIYAQDDGLMSPALTNNSTIPSVLARQFFRAANTAPTSVTNLTNGYTGKRVTLHFDNANTTLVEVANGGNFKLAGTVNLTPTTGSTVTLIFNGTNWVETGRSIH